jgi:hypothetical protein
MCTLLFTYQSIKEHVTSVVGSDGNRIYNRQFLQLRNNGFRFWGGSATANPSKISLLQFSTMSTFYRNNVISKTIVCGLHVVDKSELCFSKNFKKFNLKVALQKWVHRLKQHKNFKKSSHWKCYILNHPNKLHSKT